jgi:hypothetical protein
MPKATILQFAPRPRQTFADLCAPSREDDEKLLKVIQGFEDRGREVVFTEDPLDVYVPEPFVSEYLTRPLRTEDEARAQLNRPRIPPARGLVHEIFDLALAPFRPAGGQ